ncbi:MAG: glycosyltransferase [Alphaproteobacteria bacterium]|nr:glycosyltransferase [Alphaproteobacteria bacterium]
MNICMIVHNNVTRDGRVLREAGTLQRAGHSVTILGLLDADAASPVEYLDNGVRIFRVFWLASAYRSLIASALFRVLPVFAVIAGVLAAIAYGLKQLFAPGGPVARTASDAGGMVAGLLHWSWLDWIYAVFVVVLLAALLYTAWRVIKAYLGLFGTGARMRANEEDTVRRYAEALMKEGALSDADFPSVKSRIPGWIPDWLLAVTLEPLEWFGANTTKFTLLRYRSREMTQVAVKLKPDIVHCHDCLTLPAGYYVKKKLGIPLVYDAHEIYEAAAARMVGITDYYARIHKKYLRHVDGFICVNDSAALYYSHAYPGVVKPVVIRNAIQLSPAEPYDGRLHDAAGLPEDTRILLYQGGFSEGRGLPILVRSASMLPEGWALVMMGWGPLSGQLKQIAAQAAMRSGRDEDKVRFIPPAPQKELKSWTQGATLGIIPYEGKMLNHWIATPNKLWEYPSSGVPLVVQPFPEMRRVVMTYHCGWTLPETLTASGIADLVASLSDEQIAQARLGCMRFIEADNWTARYEKRLLDLYAGFAPKGAA